MLTLTERVADVRVVALVVVVLMHAALIAWIATARRALPVAQEQRQTVLVFLPDTREESAVQPPPERASREPRLIPAPAPLQAPLPGAPPTAPREQPPPPAIDWRQQAELSARHQAKEIIRSETGGAGPGAPHSQPANPSKPRSEFRWDRSRTNRVEAIAGGGIVVRISERCVIVISLLAMPACAVGKIPVHGDLFEHMSDPPQAGDWKDQ